MTKKFLTMVLITLILLSLTGCAKLERDVKNVRSSFSGLDREVTVYSSDGEILKIYTGKIDIETNEFGNKVKFDINGKRVIIYNAIVVTEEIDNQK